MLVKGDTEICQLQHYFPTAKPLGGAPNGIGTKGDI